MSAIRIQPEQVRRSGVATVTCGDDLRAQAAILRATPMPAMPAAMAARHQAALAGAAARLAAIAGSYAAIGEELQVRAAAAELADAPGDQRAVAAGRQLARSLVRTASIVGSAGATVPARLVLERGQVVATTSSGLRLTIADAIERPDAARGAPAAAAPDPHERVHERPAASREVVAHQPVGGAPAAAVQQAVASAPVGDVQAGAPASLRGEAVDPSDMPAGEHRGEGSEQGAIAPVADAPPPTETDRQEWACWMASTAAREGLPPALPVMMALARSGLRNMPAGESDVGFFGLAPGATYAPAGFGAARSAQPDGEWWAAHPDAQLDHVVGSLGSAGGGIRTAQLDDPEALGRWASEAAPGVDAAQFADAHTAAQELVDNCREAGAAPVGSPAGGSVGGEPLSVARSQLGVHEFGMNAGPQVDEYLASAGAASGNPWCAGFVTWSLQEAGHEMPGTGWAAVATWVNAAEAGQHGLQIVEAAAAQPGDIVAYDWGGQADFGADGHIGLLESAVGADGRFTAVEGNAQDAVTRMDRSLGEGNVVFIRFTG